MNFFKIFFATLLAIILSMVILTTIFVGSIVGLVMGVSSPVSVKPESVLVIDLNETIVDAPDLNPLSAIDFKSLTINYNITLLDAIEAIEQASLDDNIKGIYIRPSMDSYVSMAALEELRDEIKRFKASGKFVVAYADTYSQGNYYLASVADSLYLQPEGSVMWQGVATTPMFYKGLFDKLDINIEVFRPSSCLYKSAVEPLTLSKMSPENRAQSEALVNSIWASIVDDVSTSRSINRNLNDKMLNSYANSLIGFIAPDAKTAGMVDELIYEDQVESCFRDLGVALNSEGRANRVTLSNYISNMNLNNLPTQNSNSVAIIYAEGAIVDGCGEMGEIGSEDLARVIREVRLDDNIKSAVLRVNSPGGSALASDVIWREMSLLRDVKPVVVSMGAYAASGGYYISAPADVIIADRLTITGSIGVYGVLMDLQSALSSKLGVTTDSAKSNTSADFMRTSRPITPRERKTMELSVDMVYQTFTSHVSAGRNLPIRKVHEVAQGRVWSGDDAQKLGLVDGVGGLKTAILIAAQRAGIADDFSINEFTTFPNDFSSLFTPVNTAVKHILGTKLRASSPLDPLASHYIETLKQLRPLESPNGLVMFSPVTVDWQ